VLKRLAQTVNCRVFWAHVSDIPQFVLDQSGPKT
jgi:hypothetical protein